MIRALISRPKQFLKQNSWLDLKLRILVCFYRKRKQLVNKYITFFGNKNVGVIHSSNNYSLIDKNKLSASISENDFKLLNDIVYAHVLRCNRDRWTRHDIISPKLKLIYTFIPKNANSKIKQLILKAENQFSFEENIHIQAEKKISFSKILSADFEKLLVLRDPFERTVSAYLDKIARKKLEPFMETLITKIFNFFSYDLIEVEEMIASGRRPTFYQYLVYLSKIDDLGLDDHFSSQISFLSLGEYSHILSTKNLKEELVAIRPGMIRDDEFFDMHSAYRAYKKINSEDQLKKIVSEQGFDQSSSLIHMDGGIFDEIRSAVDSVPDHALFFSSFEIRDIYFSRFADDVFLYKTLFPQECNGDLYKYFDYHLSIFAK